MSLYHYRNENNVFFVCLEVLMLNPIKSEFNLDPALVLQMDLHDEALHAMQ